MSRRNGEEHAEECNGPGHFVTLLNLLKECLLCHRWKQSGKILSSLCLYPSAEYEKGMPGRELIWKCGIEMLYHHPDATYKDISQFHSKRCQLDAKVSPYKRLLDHAFYLLSEQKVKEAYGVIKMKATIGKLQQVYPRTSKQAEYEKHTLQNVWKDLVSAYTGVVAYMLWYQTGAENSADTKQEVEKFWETAVLHLGQMTDKPGVWDVFITKHLELLCSKDQMEEAVELARKYCDTNPENPNAHKYLYHQMKSNGADTSSLIEVLKDIINRLPSDELVLEYVDLLRQESKHCHKDYLPPLFNLLDFACWRDEVKPWQALADRLCSIHLKKSRLGVKVMKSCWKQRQGWWGDYHFDTLHASQIAKRDKLLAVQKATVATFLLNPDCGFVWEVTKYFSRHKKRKCLKRLEKAKEAHQFQHIAD
ncbi:TATA box-binding protein-associated factor RNA polymerase I subunit A-like isoform X2 [Amphiura filiformis]